MNAQRIPQDDFRVFAAWQIATLAHHRRKISSARNASELTDAKDAGRCFCYWVANCRLVHVLKHHHDPELFKFHRMDVWRFETDVQQLLDDCHPQSGQRLNPEARDEEIKLLRLILENQQLMAGQLALLTKQNEQHNRNLGSSPHAANLNPHADRVEERHAPQTIRVHAL